MWTIRRIRLDRVGTSAARFLNVTLDLTSPTTGQPVDSILWLRNGGGKTTIVALIGALLRPARDEFLSGGEGPRDGAKHLEDYILGPDTAHVVVEWGETDGRRLVTGAVYEWADRQPPADPNRDHDRLNAGYYAFAPVPGRLELERLPYEVGDRRPNLEAFLSHLRPFAATTDVVVTRKKLEWTKALDDRRIDSDLWRTILAMNRTEGGIEQRFLFTSPNEFVRYLLQLIVSPDEPDGVADLLRKVAAKLVRRPDILEEWRFAREAVERLAELDVAYRDDRDARGLLAIAEAQAIDLRASLHAGEDVARMTADSAESERAAAAESRRDHDRDAETARDTNNEYRRLAGIMRTEAAARAVEVAGARLVTARAAVEAWTVAPQVAAHDAAVERERALAADFATATAEAEPERVAYLAEAGHLGRLLITLAEEAEVEVGSASEAQAAATREVAEAAELLEAATRRRATLEARATELGRAHRLLDEDFRRARAEDLLAADESAAAAIVRHRADDEVALREEAAAKADIERLDEEVPVLTEARAVDRAELAETRAGLQTATEVRAELLALIDGLAAEARLAELLGADEVDPLAMAPNLLAVLREAVARSHRDLIDLGVAGAEDERALAALDSDEALLPPSLDLARALSVLAEAKIPAVAGWSYLAHMPSERRLSTFLAVPTLAGGVLVQQASDLGRARQILADADFAPTSVVGVGSTADLDAAAAIDQAGGPAAVVPANRALYDRDRARDERTIRDRAQGRRSTERAALEDRQDSDRNLIARMNALVSACPPDRQTTLNDEVTRLSGRVEDLVAAIARQTDALAGKDEERATALTRRAGAAALRLRLAGVIARTEALALREAHAADTRAEAAGLPDRIAAERESEDEARQHGVDAQRRFNDSLRRSLEMAETGRGYRARVVDLPAERTVPDVADTRPIGVLVAATDAARERYEARTTGSSLARQVEGAREERARLARELGGKSTDVVSHARQLISTASGGDPVARDRGLKEASAEAERAARQDGLAQAEVSAAAAELARYAPPEDRERHRQLDREPDSREEALALAEEQQSTAERLNRMVAEDDAKIDAAKKRFAEADRRAERLRDIAGRIRLPEVAEVPSVEPWSTTPDAASARADELLRDISDADQEVSRTKAALDDLRARILRWSGDFPTVPAEVTSRFRSEAVIDELGPEARTWRDRLALRADELESDLAALEEHRANVVTRAIGMVNEALGDLERFSRLSEMPDELGEAWGGRRFVEVHVRANVDRSDPVMRDRIGRQVDRIVDARAEPRGMDFLWQSVAAVVGDNGFTARVLKPSPTYSTERVSIEAMRKWSGGEKLTAALLLYVVVAKLRARNRGRQSAGAGAIILDNPLGKANYVPFLALQRAVARAAGVQLVFLTGVGDMRAVGLFPRIARLRNTPNLGRDYVTLDGYTDAPDEPVGALSVTHAARTSDPLPLGLD